jgi:hypothetical protein
MRNKVIYDLPGEWTPLRDLRDELERLVLEHDARCEPGNEFNDWETLLCAMWCSDRIELAGHSGRSRKPNPADLLHLIDYPIDERPIGFYDRDWLDYGRLRHLDTGRVHFGLHLRDKAKAKHLAAVTPSSTVVEEQLKPAAVPEAPSPPSPSPSPSAPVLAEGLNARERRAMLMFHVWKEAGFPPENGEPRWLAMTAAKNAKAAFEKHGQLFAMSEPELRASWRMARKTPR